MPPLYHLSSSLHKSSLEPALGVADDWQRSVEGWTVTTNGPLATHPYFIRLSKTGDPNAAISYNLGNGGPTLDQRSVIDAGFLELVRLGLKPFNDTAVTESCAPTSLLTLPCRRSTSLKCIGGKPQPLLYHAKGAQSRL